MIIVVDPTKTFRSRVVKLLGRDAECDARESIGDLEQVISQPDVNIDLVIFGPGVPIPDALATAQWIEDRGGAPAILVTTGYSPEVLHAALRAGVRDVLADGFSADQLREAVGRVMETGRRRRGGPDPASGAADNRRIVTVFSTKGGCGKSFLASNLALLLGERTDGDVALVDLDLQSGDLAIMLQLLPAWTIYDAAENLDRLDAEALRGYLTPHRSGIKLLSAPVEPALAETVSGASVKEVLTLLADDHQFVVVDGPAFFTDQILSALDVSDDIVLMASMDVPSVKNLKLALQTLDQLGIGRDRIHLVLNRADSKVGLRLQEVEKSLGTNVDVAVPSSRDVPLSINQGIPLATDKRRSTVTAALGQLADRLTASTTESRRRLIGRK